MPHTNGRSSADLEREVEAQRAQVESTIGEIKDRLTPGQLVDELLSYTKHGGAHFAANLGQTVSANPLPAALLGVSLIWLMAGPKPHPAGSAASHDSYDRWNGHGRDAGDYRAIKGSSLTRVGHARDDKGLWYSEWADAAGTKYRARSDQAGGRMGHFVDEAGKSVSGFFDDAGRRVEEFRDEAGNLLNQATGWANHAWQDASHAVGERFNRFAGDAQRLGGDVSARASAMTRDAVRLLEDQPLVMGALAFAAGAALGATLPHTRQEDEMIGGMADKLKKEAGDIAADLYEKGKEKAGELYQEASSTAGEIYDDAKRKLGVDAEPKPGDGMPSTRH